MRKALMMLVIMVIGSCTYEHLEKLNTTCTHSDLSIKVLITNASSCGSTDGKIIASADGGSKSYHFSLNDGVYQPSGEFSNLIGGNYTVSVKDSLGCTVFQVAAVNNDGTNLTVSSEVTADTSCPSGNGTITINVSGAADPIQYKINSTSFQSGNIFSNLKAGNYSITITDATNCQVSSTATVPRTGPGFSATVSPIISSQCATSGCHNGSRSPDLTSYSNIKASGSAIVSAINRNMPPGGSLTQTQINEITCWVNDGAPNN